MADFKFHITDEAVISAAQIFHKCQQPFSCVNSEEGLYKPVP